MKREWDVVMEEEDEAKRERKMCKQRFGSETKFHKANWEFSHHLIIFVSRVLASSIFFLI